MPLPDPPGASRRPPPEDHSLPPPLAAHAPHTADLVGQKCHTIAGTEKHSKARRLFLHATQGVLQISAPYCRSAQHVQFVFISACAKAFCHDDEYRICSWYHLATFARVQANKHPNTIRGHVLGTRQVQGRAPASTASRFVSPGVAVGSERGALTGRRPGLPQPRAAKRTTASWLPTSRAAALSLSSPGSSPAKHPA